MTSIAYEPFPTVPLKDFHDELKFEFAKFKLPTQLFDHYLLKTAADMAEKAPIVRIKYVIELEDGVTRYDLPVPDYLRLWAILGVLTSDGCRIGTPKRFFDRPTCGNCYSQDGVWYDEQEQVLHIERRCFADKARVTMACAPKRDACVLPAVYKTKYFSTLIMGTRAHIMLITGREWTNMRVGAELMNEYNRMIHEDGVVAHIGLMRGSVRMNFGRVM